MIDWKKIIFVIEVTREEISKESKMFNFVNNWIKLMEEFIKELIKDYRGLKK